MDESSVKTIKRTLDGMMKKFEETARKIDEEIERRNSWGKYVNEFLDNTIGAIEDEEVIFNKEARENLLKSVRDMSWDDAKERENLLNEITSYRKSIITSWEILAKLNEEVLSRH
ncbi:MAG TPA: hypothetical protein VLY03_10645 [Bacteroidota bacterium]|nr:hypothetical protein [Bacteroidota bacterium]